MDGGSADRCRFVSGQAISARFLPRFREAAFTMSDRSERSLLPNGLRDGLAPEAAHESAVLERLMRHFHSYGYDRIDPPLVEFEENLLDGVGTTMGPHTFRLMDPVSQRMMGVRADITPQVARIAATRLRKQQRPLRLTYAGSVLRVRGTQLRPERQFRQAGCELIGVDSPAADAEVIELAAVALRDVGIGRLSVDICLPTLVPSICTMFGLDREPVLAALDQKDASAVAAIGGEAGALLTALLRASGPAKTALETFAKIDLPEELANERSRLGAVVEQLQMAVPDLALTIDPVEHKGFEYQQGLSFTLFARGVRGELGRGGRYFLAGKDEPATGFTVYLDTILRAAPKPERERKVFLPAGTPEGEGARLRAEGWVAVSALSETGDAGAEARRIGCTDILRDGRVEPLT